MSEQDRLGEKRVLEKKGRNLTGSEPVVSGGLVLLIAVPTVYRPALSRLERNLGLGPAVGTFYLCHLAGSIVSRTSPIATSASRFSAIHYDYLFLY